MHALNIPKSSRLAQLKDVSALTQALFAFEGAHIGTIFAFV